MDLIGKSISFLMFDHLLVIKRALSRSKYPREFYWSVIFKKKRTVGRRRKARKRGRAGLTFLYERLHGITRWMNQAGSTSCLSRKRGEWCNETSIFENGDVHVEILRTWYIGSGELGIWMNMGAPRLLVGGCTSGDVYWTRQKFQDQRCETCRLYKQVW